MRIAIDNLDGGGALDYTAALSAASPLEITRTLDQPARCAGTLDLNASPLPVPVRHAQIVVTGDDGAVLFTGRIATAPERLFAGIGTRGHVHRLAFNAIADDRETHSLADGSAVTHDFADGDGLLHVAALETASARELARDLTLSGEIEPAAYITEYFLGDGTTATFDLTQAPFTPSGSATLLDERFDQAVLDPCLWKVTDPGSFLHLSSAGLTMSGGNGLDGQTTLATLDPLEIGGTLVITADGVQIEAASDGVLCGLYAGAIVRGDCLAGFNVRQSSGSTIVTPLINGIEAGGSLTMLSGHRYTLRLRLHCPEIVRTEATYTAVADGQLYSFGGGAAPSPATLVFEARDLGASSNTPATVLYTGSIASSPASAVFAPVNSVQLIGSIASCSIRQAGSAWIVTTLPDGTSTVRLSGSAGDGVDCSISTTGRITFFTGRVPVANERITVSYRGRRRAVARLNSTTGDESATDAWQGKVSQPSARTTADCENAALAALRLAASRSATLTGTYSIVNPPEDIAPGDILSLTAEGAAPDTLKLIVRGVTIENKQQRPEVRAYRIGFANGWSTALGMSLGGTLAADALVPATAFATPAATLANLSALAVVNATGTVLEIDTGSAPPTDGGFEVRRRDWAFGPGTDGDLVLRSPVRNFSIPRAAQVERFFVRMYSGSSTPVYSRLSSAVFTNLPVG